MIMRSLHGDTSDTITSSEMRTAPYAPDSSISLLASAYAVLLLALGASTFAAFFLEDQMSYTKR